MDIKTKKNVARRFEDIHAGDEIPAITKSYSLQKMAVFAMVHGDWCPGHYDYNWAREKWHQPAPFAYGLQITAHCSQCLTDWMGPYGALKKFKSRTVGATYPEDTLTIKGTVEETFVANGGNYAKCSVQAKKQDGTLVAEASGVVHFEAPGEG